jgi:hypothetical protein
MDAIPIWTLFIGTILLVVLAIEIGYRMGRRVEQRERDEKEAPVAAASAAVLGLLAFILAFTFGIVTNRYDARKDLVRQEANAIRTTWMRAELLPGPDHESSAKLLREYLDLRIGVAHLRGDEERRRSIQTSVRIQRQLWDTAVVNARRDLNSDIGALYIESVNELMDLHSLRVAVALHAGIPDGIWLVLFALLFLSMIVAGYQIAIAGTSRRSWVMPLFLALSFSLVIALLVALDRPKSGYIVVSQQPFLDLKAEMSAGTPLPAPLGEKP